MTMNMNNVARTRKRLSPEENRARNAAMQPGNRSIAAFRAHKGELKVYDPALM